MVNISNETPPIRDLAYYRQRQKNRIFANLVAFFADQAEQGRISKMELARRLGKDPAQITRWLSAPSNFELDTLSDILLAMGAEMDHEIVRFNDRVEAPDMHLQNTAGGFGALKPTGVTDEEIQAYLRDCAAILAQSVSGEPTIPPTLIEPLIAESAPLAELAQGADVIDIGPYLELQRQRNPVIGATPIQPETDNQLIAKIIEATNG